MARSIPGPRRRASGQRRPRKRWWEGLSPDEKAAHLARLLVGRMRAQARARGHLEPYSGAQAALCSHEQNGSLLRVASRHVVRPWPLTSADAQKS
jgi:hypothetical protein